MRKTLLDYEFGRPGDNRHTDPTYYFHRPLVSPNVSEPGPRDEPPSATAMTATVEDVTVGQQYASVSDRPGGLRPALMMSNAKPPVSVRYYRDEDKSVDQVCTDRDTEDQKLLVLVGWTFYDKFFSTDREKTPQRPRGTLTAMHTPSGRTSSPVGSP
jgi:hypothetical protein